MGHAQSSATNLSIQDVTSAASRPRVRLLDVKNRPPGFHDKVITAEDGAFFLADTRYFPVVVLKLPGSPSEVGAKRYYEWLWDMTRYAAAQGQKLIVINDFSVAEMPTPVVRKYMAEEAAKIHIHDGFGHWVPVLPNTLIRGLVTALAWMIGGEKKHHFTKTVEEAIDKSKSLATEMNLELPEFDSKTYVFPA